MITSCYRHPDRETGIHCTRCGRSICADCMIPAPVGHHCPVCVQEAQPDMRRVKNVQWSSGAGAKAGVVVKALIAVSVIAFAVQSSDFTELTYRFGNLPLAVDAGEYYRLTTATFMHANVTHLALNMFGLWIIGSMLEPVLGRVRFVVLYVVAGIGGSVAYDIFGSALVPAIGASTAVFGLFGAAFIIARSRGGDTRTILTLIAINLLFGFFMPGVDNFGHLGGLVTGAAVAGIFEMSERWRDATKIAIQVAGVAVILVGLAALVSQIRPRLDEPIPGIAARPLAVETGGVSQDGTATDQYLVGAPLWEGPGLAPPVCGDFCRQAGRRA